MKKIILVSLLLSLVSCTSSPPKELSLIKETEMIKAYYPVGWTASSGMGGGLVLENIDKTISIPINIQAYPGARINSVDSIQEILSIASKPREGVKMDIRRLSGLRCIWIETLQDGKAVITAYVPLKDNIISIMTLGKKNASGSDLELAAKMIENLEIK